MKTVGIIAEYNPFHFGHQLQLANAREKLGADYIIIAMSGDYVQRGTPALFSKQLRARAALFCGADLVVELPAAVSCASAEFFAKGGVELLEGLGVTDILSFGSEHGDMGLFRAVAAVLAREPLEYQATLREGLKSGESFPLARQRALLSYFSQNNRGISMEALPDFLSHPNNILGLEYVKAIDRLGGRMTPAPLLRKGAGYHRRELLAGELPSATAIRSLIGEISSCPDSPAHNIEERLRDYIPSQALSLFAEAVSQREFLLEEDFDLLLHYKLLSMDADELCQYMDVSPGLAQRIVNKRNLYTGFLPFALQLKTRELTQTRIQRALLHILLNIREVPTKIPCARVLGFRKNAVPLLSEIKKKGTLPLVTKPANAPKLLDAPALSVFQETVFASNVYESLLSKKARRIFRHEYTKPVIIV